MFHASWCYFRVLWGVLIISPVTVQSTLCFRDDNTTAMKYYDFEIWVGVHGKIAWEKVHSTRINIKINFICLFVCLFETQAQLGDICLVEFLKRARCLCCKARTPTTHLIWCTDLPKANFIGKRKPSGLFIIVGSDLVICIVTNATIQRLIWSNMKRQLLQQININEFLSHSYQCTDSWQPTEQK